MNPKGTASIKAGQYIDAYAIGLHKGEYSALVQVKPITYYRDKTKGKEFNYKNASLDIGISGTNIHRSSKSIVSSLIGKWSAGCQVFASPAEFSEFMRLCNTHGLKHSNKFTFTLIDEKNKL
jgi:hypothetical protein